MGADLILSFVDVTEPKQKWLDILGEWHDAQVEAFLDKYENLWDEVQELVEVVTPDKPFDRSALYQKFVEQIADAINNAYACESREVSTVRLDDKFYAVTGGLSWGDDPTDEYRSFTLAEYAIDYMKEVTR